MVATRCYDAAHAAPAAALRTLKTDATDLERPPFAVVSALAPAQVGAEMVACFKRFAGRADRLAHAHSLAMNSLGLRQTDPLLRAGAAIAHEVDMGIGAGVANGYHNAQHFLEVMLSALYLARIAGLESRRAARVVTAGLIHDFHHDGSRAGAAPFRLEQLAVQRARPYLREANVDAAQIAQLEALVLATEPRAGVPFARESHRGHQRGTALPVTGTALPRALERLNTEPELAQDAVMLAEADVLPSIGLTIEHAEALQSRLAKEWGTLLGSADKLQFIDRMIGELWMAAFFIPNVQRLRDVYARGG